ncbi:hypothetical protein [Siminovitchia sp. 179-K 8D1 HS]
MNKRITFSGETRELDQIYLFFNDTRQALTHYKQSIKKGRIVADQFIGFTPNELDEWFNQHLEELEKLVCLEMLSSTEAALRMDYLKRIYNRKKDNLSRIFRSIYREKSARASLDQDILENWKLQYPQIKSLIDDYKSLLNYRNWLAHGRYWTPKFGKRSYDHSLVFIVCKSLVENIKLLSES